MTGTYPNLTGAIIHRALAACDAELAASAVALNPAERFRLAHLAAVRAASAYLRLSGVPKPRGVSRPIWDRLAEAAPNLALWAVFLARGARTRRAVEAGGPISESDADEMIAFAEDFRNEVFRAVDLNNGYASAA